MSGRADHLKNTRWKPGQSGNPGGGSKLASLRKTTKENFHDLIDLVLNSNIEELQRIAKDPKTPGVKMGMATALATAIKKGDWDTLRSIVETLVGKTPDKLRVESSSIVRLAECDKAALKEAMDEFDDDF